MATISRVSPLLRRSYPSLSSSVSKGHFGWGQTKEFFSAEAANAAPSVVLYQYAICPFCNIAKAVMSFASVEYEAIEVNPLTKAEIKWSKDYNKVPIATLDGEQLNGSETIAEKIFGHDAIAANLNKQTFMDTKESKMWVEFAREDLASLLYPNICSTWNDSYDAFSYVKDVETFSSIQKFAIQNLGSLAMYFAASKIKQKRNITNEREALNEVLIRLEEGLEGQQYLSRTEEPNLGDIAVYGTLRSIEGLPAHNEILEGRSDSSPLPSWYQRMKAQVTK